MRLLRESYGIWSKKAGTIDDRLVMRYLQDNEDTQTKGLQKTFKKIIIFACTIFFLILEDGKDIPPHDY